MHRRKQRERSWVFDWPLLLHGASSRPDELSFVGEAGETPHLGFAEGLPRPREHAHDVVDRHHRAALYLCPCSELLRQRKGLYYSFSKLYCGC